MTEHPYITGYAAAVTGTPYVTAVEAWRNRAGRRDAALYTRDFSYGFADAHSVLVSLESEETS